MIPITTPAVEGLLCRGAPVVLYNGRNDIVQEVGILRAQLAEWGYPVEYENLTLRLDDPDGVGLLVALRYLHLQNRPLEWARYLPLEVTARLVQAHLAMIAAGGEGIKGVLGAWYQHCINCSARTIVKHPDAYPTLKAYCFNAPSEVTGRGWWVSGIPKSLWGPETGPKGRAACDAALLADGIALLEADGSVRVPTLPAHQPA